MQLDEETYDLGMEKNNNFNMAKKERASDTINLESFHDRRCTFCDKPSLAN